MRCPNPHSGAVRNSSGPAEPCDTLSASPLPMLCTSRSEYSVAAWLLSDGVSLENAVCSELVWHVSQWIWLNNSRPFCIDEAGGLPGTPSKDGVGGARKRMK